MKTVKLYTAFFMLLVIAMSCTKVIDLKLGNDSGKLVIEGNFTDMPGRQVITLSRNVPFTNTNTYPPVTGAQILVTDTRGHYYTYTEKTPGTYLSGYISGIDSTTYTMTVSTNGTKYTATSTMPKQVLLDSLTESNSLFTNKKNARQITVHFQDPAGVANYYRFILYINSVQVKSIFAFDDEFTDGRYSNLDLLENDIDVFPGDTAKVEMQCIDKPVYTYWFTLMQQDPNGPGGGVTPSNPPTNITPVSLGYFSAHTTQTETVIVK